MNFLDTDELVEKTEGRAITEIFQQDGEEYFRELETEVLKTLQDYDNFVLSTGGGMVLREENVSLLKDMGPIVLLWAEPEVIYERTKSGAHRPLLQVPEPLEEIKKRLEQRTPFYKQAADHTADTSKLSPEEITKDVLQWLKSR